MTKRIGLSLGLTLGIGQYNFERVDVRLDRDFHDDVPTSDAFDDVYDELEEELLDKIATLYEKLEDEGLVK
jgi:hypothetical protein